MMIPRVSLILLSALWLCMPITGLADTVYLNGKDFKGGYCIVPDELPERGAKLWVVVDVHGAGGLRRMNKEKDLVKLLEADPVLVLVPSFSGGYQAGDGKWAKQLIEHFEWLAKRYPVHGKMFVHGHSGGGQFAHRFAFNHPDMVVGVSAHSSGTWACDGGYGKISIRARGIPFAISCGENDKAYAYKGSPHQRIDWYHMFADKLEKKGFVLSGHTWPGVGHGVPMSLMGPRIRECFLLATRGVVPAGGQWKGDVQRLARARR